MAIDKLHEDYNDCEELDGDNGVKLEDFVVQAEHFVNSKPGLPLMSGDNLFQTALLKDIKVEDFDGKIGEGSIIVTWRRQFGTGGAKALVSFIVSIIATLLAPLQRRFRALSDEVKENDLCTTSCARKDVGKRASSVLVTLKRQGLVSRATENNLVRPCTVGVIASSLKLYPFRRQ
ncbi:hypothetical protein Trydic_g19582 [Trypoxylus dichotomus]